MPWTVADVDRFNSGLTQSQKRQWVRVANSALERCQNEGGSNCEASAIRQANGAVNNNTMAQLNNKVEVTVGVNGLKRYIQANSQYNIRSETFEGKNYIVVPVVMMREGVHAGSHGPLLHLAEELGKFEAAWNGIPVTVNHPELNGEFVSANIPQIRERSVGYVFNTHLDGDKLKAEAWIDVQKLAAVDSACLGYIRNMRPLDVSVGVFTDEEESQGNYQDEEYRAIARNHRPDHLALLPGGTGACSWEDGCGIRNNEKGKGGQNEMSQNKDPVKIKKDFVTNVLINQMGYHEVGRKIQQKLDAMDTDSRIHYLEEVYEDYFIYAVDGRERTREYYRRGYTTNEDDSVEFGTEPVQVRKNVEYVQLQNMQRTKPVKKGETTMANEKSCCPEKVDKLIANEATQFTQDDKEWLLTQEEATIDKMFPKEVEPKKEPNTNSKDEKVTAEQAMQVLKEQIKQPQDFINLLPDEMQDQMNNGLKLHQEKRTNLITGILNNTENVWKEEDLKQMDTSMLEKISTSIKANKQEVTDYTAMGGSNQEPTNNTSDGILLPAGVEVTEEK